ncbi:hypothetical protein [Hymenobacter lapidiphilus]|uniref:Uncharacterized protein n=1 Tax=Hymenobacter lapidiphilus TaxID=2608003 RepID=A0A7Y7PSA8_9BACT|nr:hypothetical protein [Hymenobacter lapidiphilus]NVO33130.1 hypothetical protein [Hymenobacter lapidiphilus]
MTIQNEQEYQAGMSRLDSPDSTNPDNSAEMEALGNALKSYEDSHGHAPVRADSPTVRIKLAAQGSEQGPGHNARTDHLRPVIDFLLAKDNRPSHHWH